MAQIYREIMTVTGNFARVQIAPARPMWRGRRKKTKLTSGAQERVNRENRINLLSDIINLNFDKNDYKATLDYSLFYAQVGRMPTEDEADRMSANFLRRLKRLFEKNGLELKRIINYEIGERGIKLCHHHLIFNSGIDLEQIRKLWQWGGVHFDKLYFDRYGVRDLAAYFCKQEQRYRAYSCSRNLRRPRESGRDRCIYRNNSRIRQKTVTHITDSPDDIEFIRRLYPGWEVAGVPYIAQVWDEKEEKMKLPGFGTFMSFYLYKPEGLTDPSSVYNEKNKYYEWPGEMPVETHRKRRRINEKS